MNKIGVNPKTGILLPGLIGSVGALFILAADIVSQITTYPLIECNILQVSILPALW